MGIFASTPTPASPERSEVSREQPRCGSAADLSAIGMPVSAMQGCSVPGLGLDHATAAYGAQLKAWIDMQVDARLNVVVPRVLDRELASFQQESAATVRLYQHLEQDLEL